MIAKFLPSVALLLLGIAPFSVAADTTVIAKVGDSEVKADDIKPMLEKLPVRDQLLLARDPAALNEFIRTLIVQQLVYKEALSKKWEQQPQVIAQLERIRQQAITQSYLQMIATPPQDFPSQEELQVAYDTLKKNNALQVPKQYHLAQIYVACPKGADKSAEAKSQTKLDAIIKALKTADFPVVAEAQSDEAASAKLGGDLGMLLESQIQPEIRSAVVNLSKGGTTDPIRMNDGWHIIKLIEVKDPYIASLQEMKAPLISELRNKDAKLLSNAYLSKILQKHPITINEISASKLIDIKGN